MLRLLTQRVLLAIPLLFVVCAGTFLLIELLPGDAAQALAGQTSSDEQIQQLRESLGLDQPLLTRLWEWIDGALHGDLGLSQTYGLPVTEIMNSRLSVTLSLVVGTTLVAAVLGVALGIAGALHVGPVGRFVDGLSLAGLAVPSFFLGLLLVSWLAISIPVFPATGYVPFSTSPTEWFRSLVLPVVTLALPGVAVIAKQTRDSILETMTRPFVRTLRASGVTRRSILYKHVLRNASVSVLTVVGLVFVGALGGTVIVESVFALPGLGGLAVEATLKNDVPIMQGVVLYFTVIVIIVNLLVDVAYAALDPRIRAS